MTAQARFPDPSRSQAVLIGTAAYRDAALPELPAVGRNLTGLAGVLTSPNGGGWCADRITVIRNPATALTGELLDRLTSGIPHGPAELTLGVIYPHLRQRLTARGLPRPQQRGTDTADRLVLVRNPARTSPDTAIQAPWRSAPPRLDTGRLADSDRPQAWSWQRLLRSVAIRRRRDVVLAVASVVALGGAAAIVLSVHPPASPPQAAPISKPAASSTEPPPRFALAPPDSGVTKISDIFGPACSYLPKDGPGSAQVMAYVPVATAVSHNPELTTLTKAVRAANLGDILNSAEMLIVFAPADAAFQALEAKSPGILTQLTTAPDVATPGSKLTKILTYQMVDHRYDAAGLVQAGVLDTLDGAKIKIGGTAAAPTVNGAPVLCGNIPTKNATVFVIGQVLSLPAS
jgi:uncharacterized surface protein with fasciclin (FAS1) repeats